MRNELILQPSVGSLTVDEQKHLSAKRMYVLHNMRALSKEEAVANLRNSGVMLRNLFYLDPSTTIKLSISYGMFTNVIVSLGTERHLPIWEEAENGNVST